MIVTLIGKNVLYKLKLPSVAIGNYWLTDENQEKLINIEGKDGEWEITGGNKLKIIKPKALTSFTFDVQKAVEDRKNLIEKAKLTEYSMNYIYLKNYSKDLFIVYCTPTVEKRFMKLDFENTQEISIGSDKNNDIIYRNLLVKDKHARIFYSGGKLIIENFDTNFGTFVNGNVVTSKMKLLLNGDVVFILGLKIIILGKSIYINNPFNLVKYNKNLFTLNHAKYKIPKQIDSEDDNDNNNIELYSENEYFARMPRITSVIEHEKLKIDSPPENQDKEGTPIALTLASSMAMGLISVISLSSTLSKVAAGETTLKDSFSSILMSFAMLVSMLLIPIISAKYEKRRKKKKEEIRQERYSEYINSKIESINKIKEKQREILYKNYISTEECIETILHKDARFWGRKIEEDDFLRIRLGIGDLPLDLEIQYPEKEFSMEDDNLVEKLNEVAKKSKTLHDVPITVSLTEKKVMALIIKDNDRLKQKFLQSLILQLVALHGYDELKLVFLMKEDITKIDEHLKTLPHIWDDTKQIRFWANNYTEMKNISTYLEKVFASRMEAKANNGYKSFLPYYVIITDNYKQIETLDILKKALETPNNMGFSIFCIADNMLNLPYECQAFINLDQDNGFLIEKQENGNSTQNAFDFDATYTFFFENIGRILSNTPIKYSGEGNLTLPDSYTFLEMYDAGRVEQLNVLERWKKNDSTVSLAAPIGIDSAGMPIVLDVHEKYHGPHGLVAGSTGSGKSEFIITYILSLTINYHPDDVNLILIDYKGGGLAGAFQKNEVKLPHLIGTITNIEKSELQRSLASIQSELRRRQVAFNEARNQIDDGTIDIYKYQKLYHEGVVKDPIPHLLIISDEFAELKQQQPEFMDELISVARIGRSLGVHLILATQKPAGVVNDQIRSNSKFGICLKVQSTSDSNDVINRPDAAKLKRAGQFYMQVGNDEYFVLGQAAYAGAPYIPSDVVKKQSDNSLKFVSNTGAVIKEVSNEKKQIAENEGDQLSNIVKYIYQLAKQEEIKTKPLWKENIPEIIYLDDVRKKYKVKKEKNIVKPLIGEFDDPYNQRQGPVELNLSKNGNTIIYGNAESGKETLLSTIIFETISTYDASEVNMYLIDLGSEVLKIFKDSSVVGDVIYATDEEKINRLFEMIQAEIKKRTAILSDYSGDYNLYINTDDNKMPMMIIVINNYDAFTENFRDKYDDTLLTITREGIKYGIIFIFTVSSYGDIRFRLGKNFNQRIVLQLNSDDDYFNIFNGIGKKRPAHLFGRGLVKMEDIYEFQTARICDTGEWNKYIRKEIERLNGLNEEKAKSIPILPKRLLIDDVKAELKDITQVPFGMGQKDLNILTYNFKKNFITIISGKNIDIVAEYISHLAEEIRSLKDSNVEILDAEGAFQSENNDIDTVYHNILIKMNNNLSKGKHQVCIVIGIDKFINKLANKANEFTEFLQKAEISKNYSFILTENSTKLKNHQYDNWYKEYITGEDAIWVGSGITDQYVISTNLRSSTAQNACGNSFGYIVNRGKATFVKLLGMKDRGDEDE